MKRFVCNHLLIFAPTNKVIPRASHIALPLLCFRLCIFLFPFSFILSPPVYAHNLADAAAAASPHQFVSLPTTTPPVSWADFLHSCSLPGVSPTWDSRNTGCASNNIMQWADGGVWDAVDQTLLFHGGGHLSKTFMIWWNAATDTWSRQITPWDSGHAHDQMNAWDPVRRTMFARQSHAPDFWQYDRPSNTWAQRASLPESNSVGPSGGLVFFPDRDRVLHAEFTWKKIWEFNPSTNTWTLLQTLDPSAFPSGTVYNTFCEYSAPHQAVICGGGNAGATPNLSMWKITAAGTVTRLTDLPFEHHNLGVEGTGGLTTVDPVTGNLVLLHYDKTAKQTAVWEYQVATDTYRQISTTLPQGITASDATVGGPVHMIGIPVPQYGGIIYMKGIGTSSGLWFYKHANGTTSPPPPDTILPTTPTNLNATTTSSSEITLTWAPSTDNVGIAGYRVSRNQNLISISSNTSFVDTGLAAATSYTYTVAAVDTAGNVSPPSTSIQGSTSSSGSPPPPPPPPPSPSANNTITIYDTAGTGQNNRPVSIARPFKQGEIPQCVAALVAGTAVTTQTDVKNRWADGSLKHAIISFLIPSIPANESVTVHFSNQANCNNTGALTQTQMLASTYDFQTTLNLTNGTTKTVQARTMLANGHWRYWLQGPIVTAVIIEDRTPARTYDLDFGTATKNLHPIIEAWFYPQTKDVEVGATIENSWASSTAANTAADTTYSLTIQSGHTNPTMEYTHGSFNHIAFSRWHRRFWNGTTTPPGLGIDHNLSYLVTTGAIPHYDTSLTTTNTINDTLRTQFAAESGTLDGSDGHPSRLGNYKKSLNGTGAAAWIGLQATWEVNWLYSMANEDWQLVLGNADLAGRLPYYFREGDSAAGQGNFFDQPWTPTNNWCCTPTKNGTGTVETFGRPVSINARPTVMLCCIDNSFHHADDRINHGTVTDDGWGRVAQLDSSHHSDACYTAYLFSGRYYYLDCLQLEAAYNIAWKTAAYGSGGSRPGPVGLHLQTNIRGQAWSYKILTYAAFISPDGEPEQAYFIDKLHDVSTMIEGIQNITPLTHPEKQEVWDWGRSTRAGVFNITGGRPPSPLGQWYIGDGAFVASNFMNSNLTKRGNSPWETHFLLTALGMANQMKVDSTTQLLAHHAKWDFNILLNPETYVGNPPTVPLGPYQIEAFWYPTSPENTDEWIQTWGEYLTLIPQPDPALPYTPANGWRTGVTPDHHYRYIARAAVSFMTGLTVDGYTGQQAWDFFVANAPDPTNDFQASSPKWAIVPIVAGSSSPPNDTIPPNAPQNVELILLE